MLQSIYVLGVIIRSPSGLTSHGRVDGTFIYKIQLSNYQNMANNRTWALISVRVTPSQLDFEEMIVHNP